LSEDFIGYIDDVCSANVCTSILCTTQTKSFQPILTINLKSSAIDIEETVRYW